MWPRSRELYTRRPRSTVASHKHWVFVSSASAAVRTSSPRRHRLTPTPQYQNHFRLAPFVSSSVKPDSSSSSTTTKSVGITIYHEKTKPKYQLSASLAALWKDSPPVVVSSRISSSKTSGFKPIMSPNTADQQQEELKECNLPMEMECGCKTKRLKEMQEAEILAKAAAKLTAISVADIATTALNNQEDRDGSITVTRTDSSTAAAIVHHHHTRSIAFESTFHRRILPQDCIAFSSPEGRKLFTEAINSPHNYMQIYFPLAEQFITQAEPAYCGLATLAMCLNALQIDPGRLWKGSWRWFSEELFDCCTSLSVAKEKGISLSEFICLARCNGVMTEDMRATSDFTLEDFRSIVQRSCSTSSEIVVLNYSRKVLGQTGDGHFSPIGGYHAERDMVLLLDVARFKYPPHWVRLSLVYEAMQRLDESIGLPRGLVVLKESAHATGPTLVKQLVHSADPSTPVKPAPHLCCSSSMAIESARHVSGVATQQH